jgi:hypothetical protein
MEILKNQAPDGELLEVIYDPEKGMNLISYRKGDLQIIDQTTRSLFEERSAGLGALIGPHFHERENPKIDFDTSIFPHVAKMVAAGRKDPFSHGIARYVPWKYVKSETQIQAKLSSSDLYQGVPLAQIEGQDFVMKYEARLLSDGLSISYAIRSEKPSIIGLHYYYTLAGTGKIQAEVTPFYRKENQWDPLPVKWTDTRPSHLCFSLPQKADFGFIPDHKTEIEKLYHLNFETKTHRIHFDYASASEEKLSFQIFHPENSSYVCIEPLSSRNPLTPKLLDNHLEVKIQIFGVGKH